MYSKSRVSIKRVCNYLTRNENSERFMLYMGKMDLKWRTCFYFFKYVIWECTKHDENDRIMYKDRQNVMLLHMKE